MPVNRFMMSCIAASLLCAHAHAQIYESRDAQGNPVFSDKPSAGSSVVEMTPTNIADAVDIPEEQSPAPASEPDATRARYSPEPDSAGVDAQPELHGNDDWLYYGDDDLDDTTRRERRREDGDGARPGGDRPVVTPHRDSPHPAAGIGGRR